MITKNNYSRFICDAKDIAVFSAYLYKDLFLESLLPEIEELIKSKLNEFDTSSKAEALFENCDSATEQKNEKFVESVAKKYKLIYNKGDSVCCSKEKRTALEIARNIISQKMPAHPIKWVGSPENQYYFTFQSWKTKSI